MNWGTYLVQGPYVPIFHMCDELYFKEKTQSGNDYFSPHYESDGFIHATANPKDLLVVGNHFYKGVKGEWICLELNPYFLLGTVVYEAPAAVGNIETMKNEGSPKFPHIYGGIPVKSIVKMHKIFRGEDGSFLTIENIV